MGNSQKHQTTPANWQTERLVPQTVPWFAKRMVREHLDRYEFACKFIKDKVVIDVACGTGFGSYILAKAGAKQIISIDNDSSAIGTAQIKFKNNKISYIIADAQKIPLRDNVADTIISFETIEHLTDPRKFLRELHRLLNPKGTLLISTPNEETSYGDNPFHIKEYTLIELKKLLNIFPKSKFYGQRPLNKKIISLYKNMMNKTDNPIIKTFLRFRPWEQLSIKELKSNEDTDYLYFLAVCHK